MFCPKCGEEQASESIRFCSRCGFKLNNVEESLTTLLAKIAMFLLLTACAIFGWGSVTTGPSYFQVRVIVALIAALTFYLLFSRDLKHIFHKLFSHNIEPINQLTANQKSGLPPVQSIPLPTPAARRINTAEMLPPPSVTEQTTTLLDKNRR